MKPDATSVVTNPKAAVRLLRYPGCRELEQGFQRVASYRLYGLDGVRKVASGEWIEADDDRAAVAAAKERFGYGRCEIWQGPRLVARLDSRDEGEGERA